MEQRMRNKVIQREEEGGGGEISKTPFTKPTTHGVLRGVPMHSDHPTNPPGPCDPVEPCLQDESPTLRAWARQVCQCRP